MLFKWFFTPPLSVYKPIVCREAVQLRRLNEKQEHYLECIYLKTLECLTTSLILIKIDQQEN